MSEIEKNMAGEGNNIEDEIEVEDDNSLNTSNIFDEFEIDDSLKDEIEKNSVKKDFIYFAEKIWMVFKYINYCLIFIAIIAYSYIFIQTSHSEFVDKKEYLNPICDTLNGKWISNIFPTCSWIYYSNKNLEDKEISFLKKMVVILQNSYELESVKNSKEAMFLIEKTNNKNDPVQILNEFDKIKNKFAPILKSKIKCENINITWNILQATCHAYSTAWSTDIPWLEWKKTTNTISWTSISLASSFINFLSNSDNFNVIDKQKKFNKNPYFWEGAYVYQTEFKINLEYINNLTL